MYISEQHAQGSMGSPGRGTLICVAVILFVQMLAALVFVSPAARADGLSYAYDAAGRLIQATNTATGQAIFYSYDAAGNITSQQVVARHECCD
jgi:YD repeat-containing protein